MRRSSNRSVWRDVLWIGAAYMLVLGAGVWFGARVLGITGVRAVLLSLAIALLAGGLALVLVARVLVTVLRALERRVRGGEQAHEQVSRRQGETPLVAYSELTQRLAAQRQVLERKSQELEALTAVVRALCGGPTAEGVLDSLLGIIVRSLEVERVYIAAGEPEGGEYELVASRGYSALEQQELVASVRPTGVLPGHIVFPLRAASTSVGILGLATHPVTQEDRQFLGLLSGVLATTIGVNRAIESARREARAQRLTVRAGQEVTSTLDTQEVLTRIMREAIQAVAAEEGSVVLVDRERGDLFFAAAASPLADELVGMRMPVGRGIVGWAIEHEEAVLSADVAKDPRFYEQIDQQTGASTQSVACVPLFRDQEVIGAIEVLNARAGQFTADDLALLQALAPQAAIAIDNATLFENVKAQMAELEQTQSQLLQAEKLSAIGELVAGIAHEINNPLTAIIGYTQLLLETCEEPEVCEDLERIHQEAQRSAQIVRSLLTFARQQKAVKEIIDLNEALSQAVDLVDYQLRVDDIALVRVIPEEPIYVLGDRYQLQQVFLNLITNAHQAMRSAYGQGTLTIRSQRIGASVARVEVIDDGPGVPADIAHRIFDPFFTTKEVGEGSGLGLSICLGILAEHDGRIWLDERVERGATFVVELPLHKAPPQRPPSAVEQPLSILIVDGGPEVDDALREILEDQGHRVVTCPSEQQALDEIDAQAFDVVICEIDIPGRENASLCAHIAEAHPDLKERVIFLAGDRAGDGEDAIAFDPGRPVLERPVEPEALRAELAHLLADESRLRSRQQGF